jgi:arylsulfatase A-like enzyme
MTETRHHDRPGPAPAPPSSQLPEGTSPPNIVFLLADNFGCGEPGCYGGGITRGAPTPNIDRLAGQGLKLTNACVEAQCTPSRSAIMTGRHAIRSGTHTVPMGGHGMDGLVLWEQTIANLLSDAGYATGHFGKWHLGSPESRLPHRQGFDRFFGIPRSTDESWWPDDPQAVAAGTTMTYMLEAERGQDSSQVGLYDLAARRQIDSEATRRAIAFMQENAGHRPFYVYLPWTQVHVPSLPHPDFAGRTGAGDFADSVVELDHHVGEVLAAVDELGLADTTIVIFTSDNGPDPGWPYSGSAGQWSGFYFTHMEGSSRVPFIIRWPGMVPAGAVSNDLFHEVDTYTTLALWAGATVPTDRAVDGLDQRAFLTGRGPSARTGHLVFVADRLEAVVWGDYKCSFYARQRDWWTPAAKLTLPQLFHLPSDPHEEHPWKSIELSWVFEHIADQAQAFIASLREHWPIRAGTPDPYQPRGLGPSQMAEAGTETEAWLDSLEAQLRIALD